MSIWKRPISKLTKKEAIYTFLDYVFSGDNAGLIDIYELMDIGEHEFIEFISKLDYPAYLQIGYTIIDCHIYNGKSYGVVFEIVRSYDPKAAMKELQKLLWDASDVMMEDYGIAIYGSGINKNKYRVYINIVGSAVKFN